MMGVARVIKVLCMYADDGAANSPRFGIPADAITNLKFLCHDGSPQSLLMECRWSLRNHHVPKMLYSRIYSSKLRLAEFAAMPCIWVNTT